MILNLALTRRLFLNLQHLMTAMKTQTLITMKATLSRTHMIRGDLFVPLDAEDRLEQMKLIL